MVGRSFSRFILISATFRRIKLVPSTRAVRLTWSRWVFKCKKEKPVFRHLKVAQLAVRTLRARQLEEYLLGVVLSQNPPESSTSSRVGSKKIALNSYGALLPARGPSTRRYWGSFSSYVSRFPLCSS